MPYLNLNTKAANEPVGFLLARLNSDPAAISSQYDLERTNPLWSSLNYSPRGTVMPNFKTDYSHQNMFVSVIIGEQLIPGTIEYAISHIVDNQSQNNKNLPVLPAWHGVRRNIATEIAERQA